MWLTHPGGRPQSSELSWRISTFTELVSPDSTMRDGQFFCCWPFASFRCHAQFARFLGEADIDHPYRA